MSYVRAIVLLDADSNARVVVNPAEIVEDDGGSSLLKTATVTLTNAQIKALPTTPVVIVPATEVLGYSGFPTTIFLVSKALLRLDCSAGIYTNVDNDSNILLCWGSDASTDIGIAAAIRDDTTSTPSIFPSTFDFIGGSDPTKAVASFLLSEGFFLTDGLQDNAVALFIHNTLGNFTGGNAANTLKVTVYYMVVDVS